MFWQIAGPSGSSVRVKCGLPGRGDSSAFSSGGGRRWAFPDGRLRHESIVASSAPTPRLTASGQREDTLAALRQRSERHLLRQWLGKRRP